LRNVAGNVGSEPIAVTLLQQQNGVQRSAKKAVAHQWQESLIGRAVADASVEGMAPCLVERGNRAHRFLLRELARRMPAYFTVARVHASLGNVMVYARIIHKNSDLVNVKPTIIIGKFQSGQLRFRDDRFNRTGDRHRRRDGRALRLLNEAD
jgi:hypothetical protein